MFQSGDIVYFDEFTFNRNIKDNKKNRPCVVLETTNDGDSIFCVPLTSQVKSFNQYNYKYCLIPTVVYNYKKMSFASLESLTVRSIEDANFTGIKVDLQVVERIINKITYNRHLIDNEYIDLLKEIHDEKNCENRQQAKRQKRLIRKLKKQNIYNEQAK